MDMCRIIYYWAKKEYLTDLYYQIELRKKNQNRTKNKKR